MILHIDDGVNVDPSWVNMIAVSYDGGTNWTTINKHGMNVLSRFLNYTNVSPSRHPWVNKGSHGRISLTIGSNDNAIMDFDVNDVANQLTWQGNTPAALQAAVAEISGWL